MGLISKATIAKSDNFNIEKVDVTEWGEIDPATGKPVESYLYVRELSGAEKDAFEEGFFTRKKGKVQHSLKNARAKFAVLACCDENRKPIFSPGDEEWLTTKSVKPLERIMDAGKRLNEISDDDEENWVKNSSTDQT